MAETITLIGNTADFQHDTGVDSPDWEHSVLLRTAGSKALPIDALRSSGITRLLRNRFFDLGKLYRIARAVRKSSFVLAQSEQSGYDLASAIRVFSPRKSFSIIFHGHRWWTASNRAHAKRVGRMKGARFFCLSRALGTLLEQEYKIDPAKIVITGYGADARFFQPDLTAKTDCIVSAGMASRDFKSLVQACDGLDIPVRIAADSTWYREELNTAGLAVPANVEIFSAGGYVALRSLYASALFVVVPLLNVRYACGYAVIAEAMAMGKAVIVTRTEAPSDLVEDGVTGLYVPPEDIEALRAAITRLLSDRELTLQMGRAARAAVERSFNLQAYVGRIKTAIGMPQE